MTITNTGKTIILVGLAFYNFIDALSPRGMPFWAPVYAITLTSIILGNPSAFLKPSQKLFRSPATWIITTMLATGCMQAFRNTDVSLHYALSDFIKLLSVLIFFIVAADPQLSINRTDFKLALFALLFAALVAPFAESFLGAHAFKLQTRFESSGRFEPPHYVLPVLLSIAYLCTGAPIYRLLCYLFLIIVAALSLFSQQRLNFGQCLLAPLVCFIAEFRFLSRTRVQQVAITAFVTFVAFMLSAALFYWNVGNRERSELLARIRFSELASDGRDTSTIGRFNEATDVLTQIRNADWVELYLGFGHGAELRVRETELHINAADGKLHHIHFGFFQLLYRHGLLGALAYVLLLARLARPLLPFFYRTETRVERMFGCAAVLAFLQFSFFGGLHDLVGCFVIAGALFVKPLPTVSQNNFTLKRFEKNDRIYEEVSVDCRTEDLARPVPLG